VAQKSGKMPEHHWARFGFQGMSYYLRCGQTKLIRWSGFHVVHTFQPAMLRRLLRCLVVAALLLHAEAIVAAAEVPRARAAIRLAIFDFELEDLSAGPGESPADTHLLKQISTNARGLIMNSGRYSLVDTSRATAPEVTGRWLHQCHGCDAGIALKLGAQQSLLGYVTRISRTEYMVRILIREAKTADIVSDFRTGLRLGADYSWDRGVRSLIDHQILKEITP